MGQNQLDQIVAVDQPEILIYFLRTAWLDL